MTTGGGALVQRMGNRVVEWTKEGNTRSIRINRFLQGENGLQNALVITYEADQLGGRGWT